MKKVLLVNDCKLEGIIMKDYLNNLGYEVNITNEYQTLVQISKFEPDIVIVNLVMKDTTGDKLIKKIKKRSSDIGCILSSCNPIVLENFKKSGVDEIINTPIQPKELEEVMSNILVKINQSQQNQDEEIKFKFCPYCGQNLKETSTCFSFCPYCGEKFK